MRKASAKYDAARDKAHQELLNYLETEPLTEGGGVDDYRAEMGRLRTENNELRQKLDSVLDD